MLRDKAIEMHQKVKKPPIYLPELRDRQDVWKTQQNTLTNQGSKGTLSKNYQLKGNKNWFLVPQKNVFL